MTNNLLQALGGTMLRASSNTSGGGSSIALSGNDVVSIMIFGILFLLFGYGSVFGIYISSIKKIKDNQETIYGVMLKAFILQIVSLIAIWFFISIIDTFSKYSSASSIDAGTATLLFFKVNWLEVNLVSVIDSLQNSGASIEIASLLFIIIAIWIALTIVFMGIPLFLIGTFIFMGYRKATQQSNNTSQVDVITAVLSTLVFTIVVFTIHFLFPAVFLKGIAKSHSLQIVKYTKGLPTFNSYTYKSRVKNFVEKSIKIKKGK